MDNHLVLAALGSDQTGIVDEISRTATEAKCSIADSRMVVMGQEFSIIMMLSGTWDAIASQHMNIESLETSTYAAPHTGSPMFALNMIVNIPAKAHLATLRENFILFCDDRNLDAILEPYKN